MPDGVYDGSKCSPAKRQAIKEQVLAGEPVQAIARDVHASEHTVMLIRDQELPDWRKIQSNGLGRFSANVIQSLLAMTPEQLAATGLSERCVALGIAMDKKALLDGEPTSIVEHKHTIDLGSLGLSLPQEIAVVDLNADTTHTVEPSTSPESTHLLSNSAGTEQNT